MVNMITLLPEGTDVDVLQPGQMLTTTDPKTFIKACPKCGQISSIGSVHTITVHPDRTVTIRASCLCPYEGCDAHYFVTNSRIDWC